MDQLEAFLSRVKETRIEKNISIEEISESTKINAKFIGFLEEGRTDFLPGPYVRAFVKSYARAVGIAQREIEEVLSRTPPPPAEGETAEKGAAQPEPETREAEKEPQPAPVSTRKIKPILPEEKESLIKGSTIRVLLIVIPLIAGLVYVGTQLNQSRSRFEVANIPVTEEEKENVANQKEPEPPQIETRQLELRAVAQGTTWLRLITDRRDTVEHNLREGDQVNWSAFSSFQFRIGRAHAVRLYLNGRDLGELGPRTQLVWDMLITSNGIESKELRTRTDIPQENSPPGGQSAPN